MKSSRTQLLAYSANPPASLIGLEACVRSHFLGVALRKQSNRVRPPFRSSRGTLGSAIPHPLRRRLRMVSRTARVPRSTKIAAKTNHSGYSSRGSVRDKVKNEEGIRE